MKIDSSAVLVMLVTADLVNIAPTFKHWKNGELSKKRRKEMNKYTHAKHYLIGYRDAKIEAKEARIKHGVELDDLEQIIDCIGLAIEVLEKAEKEENSK